MILCILSKANVALEYALCRYDGSGGEERANTNISGSCGIHKLGSVSIERGVLCPHTCRYRTNPGLPWARIVQSRALEQPAACNLSIGISQVWNSGCACLTLLCDIAYIPSLQ